MGFVFGIAPGVGVASPVNKVFERGPQWGTSFTAMVGCRIGNHCEVAMEPFLFYKGNGGYDATDNMFSKKVARNFGLITASWFLHLKRDWHLKTGLGMASYVSYNKPAPPNVSASWGTEGNYGNNALGYMVGVGYDLHIGKSHTRLPIGIYYYGMRLKNLKFESAIIDSTPIQTGAIVLQIGIAIKS